VVAKFGFLEEFLDDFFHFSVKFYEFLKLLPLKTNSAVGVAILVDFFGFFQKSCLPDDESFEKLTFGSVKSGFFCFEIFSENQTIRFFSMDKVAIFYF